MGSPIFGNSHFGKSRVSARPWGLSFGAWDLAFRVFGFGFRVLGVGFGCEPHLPKTEPWPLPQTKHPDPIHPAPSRRGYAHGEKEALFRLSPRPKKPMNSKASDPSFGNLILFEELGMGGSMSMGYDFKVLWFRVYC